MKIRLSELKQIIKEELNEGATATIYRNEYGTHVEITSDAGENTLGKVPNWNEDPVGHLDALRAYNVSTIVDEDAGPEEMSFEEYSSGVLDMA